MWNVVIRNTIMRVNYISIVKMKLSMSWSLTLSFIFVIIHVSGLFDPKKICAGCFYVLPLDIQLSKGDDFDPINRFNPATLLCLYQATIWFFVFSELWREMFTIEILSPDDNSFPFSTIMFTLDINRKLTTIMWKTKDNPYTTTKLSYLQCILTLASMLHWRHI